MLNTQKSYIVQPRRADGTLRSCNVRVFDLETAASIASRFARQRDTAEVAIIESVEVQTVVRTITAPKGDE